MCKMEEDMFEYVKENYSVPACIGREVIVDGEYGIITEDRGNYIGVNFDHDKPGVVTNCHPTWRVEYRGIGKVRKMTASQKRYKRYLEVSECFDDFKHFLDYEMSTPNPTST